MWSLLFYQHNVTKGDLLPEADGVANPVVACFPLRFDK